MLRLQRKNIRNKIAALLQLIMISTGTHVGLLGLLFFVYNGGVSSHIFHVNKRLFIDGVPVIIVGHMQQSRPAESTVQKRAAVQPKTGVQKQKQSLTPPVAVARKSDRIKSNADVKEKKMSTVAATVDIQKKENSVVKAATVVAQKESPKKIETEKQEISKPQVPEQLIAKKINQKDVSVLHQELEKKSVTQVVPVDHDSHDNCREGRMQAIVVNNYKEKVALTKQFAFERTLTEAWHPPIGVHSRSCTLKIHTKHDGTIRGIEMVRPSGLTMYDVQARSAVLAITMPRNIWGSAVEITFEC
jgi:hypothetical protein